MPGISVLFLHASGAFGGASKSLCELLAGMPADSVDAVILCPHGSAAAQFRRTGARVEAISGVPKWDHTRFSYYRGLRWLLLLREAAYFATAWLAVRRLRRQIEVDLVHANDITLLPFAERVAELFGVPLIVHARSLQNDTPGLRRTRWRTAGLLRSKARVIAIDETVRRSLPAEVAVQVIHNGLRIPPQAALPPAARKFRVAIIGVLLRLKGVFEFVAAAEICRARGLDVEFWIVGENVREVRGLRGRLLSWLGFAEDVRAGLEQEIRARGLEPQVKLLGFVEDVASIYRQIDVLCFPSYLDAAGRPVFEAAWFGVPSVVAVREPLPDTIAHGESGLCIAASTAEALAEAIIRLHADPAERRRLGEGAMRLARKYFDQEQNSRQVLELYRATIHHKRAPADRTDGRGIAIE